MKKVCAVFLAVCCLAGLLSSCGGGGKKLSKKAIDSLNVSDLESYEWIGLYEMDYDIENNRYLDNSECYDKITFNKEGSYFTVTRVDTEDGSSKIEETVHYQIIDDSTIKIDYGDGISWMATISERVTNDAKTVTFLEFNNALFFNGDDILVPLQCIDTDSVYRDDDLEGHYHYVWNFR